MFNEYYVVGQVQYSTTEGDFDVIAKFEYHEEAQKLVEAKQIAEDLERQAIEELSKSPVAENTVKFNQFKKEYDETKD